MDKPTEHQCIDEQEINNIIAQAIESTDRAKIIALCEFCRISISNILIAKMDQLEQQEGYDENEEAQKKWIVLDVVLDSLKINVEKYEKGKKLILLEGLNLNSLEEIGERLRFSSGLEDAANLRFYGKRAKALGIDPNSLKKFEERLVLVVQGKPTDTKIAKTGQEAEDFRKFTKMVIDGYNPPDDPDVKIIRNEQAVRFFLKAVLGIKQVVGDEEFLAKYRDVANAYHADSN